jgi:hypothetical protein
MPKRPSGYAHMELESTGSRGALWCSLDRGCPRELRPLSPHCQSAGNSFFDLSWVHDGARFIDPTAPRRITFGGLVARGDNSING